MSEKYPPRRLPRNRDYPGYQFYCTLIRKDGGAESCFCFAVLCVIDWLKQRLRETNVIPEQITRLPERQKASEIRPADLESFTISSGFSAYAVSLPGHGIWTLRLKEPDSDTDQRKAFPGRFFATNVGFRIMDENRVELGIRIDVTEPEEASEVDYAFRPGFVRYLYAEPDLLLAQVSALPYQQAVPVEDDEQMKALRCVLDSSEALLPVVVVTQAARLSAEKKEPVFSRTAFPAVQGAPASRPAPPVFAAGPVLEFYYPFSADNIASHSFGHAVTFRVSEKMRAALAKRLKKDYTPGDILFVEPKRFGGRVRVLGKDEKDVAGQIRTLTHSYSKNRKYSFGDVQFEFDARNIESREMISRIRSSGNMKDEEKLNALNQTIDGLQKENEKMVRKISQLREQLLSEFKRGEDAEKARTDQLYKDFDHCEEELRKARAWNQQLERENREARANRGAVETMRGLAEMPRTNGDVVNYFINVFGDRIVFTERGVRTACKCGIKADGLWFYLYQMATALCDIHRAGRPDVEKEFFHATGIEAAMGEGSQSRKDNKIMSLRKDVYEGKELWVEPHVKLSAQKAGAEHQRIYYCYDQEIDKIIVGWVGDHMRTYGTQFVN